MMLAMFGFDDVGQSYLVNLADVSILFVLHIICT